MARNRLQRRLREIVRRQILAELGSVDLVVRARSSAYSSAFGDLTADLVSWAQSRSA